MAPRSIWRGSLTFGLISVPVRVYTAVGRKPSEKIDLHLLHAADSQRIHYERTCEGGHQDIDWDEIVKGYEYEEGKWIEITDEDMESIELESLRTIDIQTFSPIEQIDPLYFDKSYYLVPDEAGVKAYRLIADALQDEGLVGVAKVALRDREHLSALRIKDGVMILETMHWPEEIREAGFEELDKRPRVDDRERKMARQLINQLTEDFDPSRFTDEYHSALQELIDKKIEGSDIVAPEAKEEPDGDVIDLMEALKASVEAAKKGKTSSSGGTQKLDDFTKAELEEKARDLEIAGRSKMDKAALIDAIQKSA